MSQGAIVSLLNTVSLSEFTDLTEKMFKFTMEMFVETGKAGRLFTEVNLEAHTGDTKRMDEVDVETFASVKHEGDNASKARVAKGYFVIMTMRRYAKEIDITWEMRRLNKHPEVVTQLTSLSHFIPQRMELDMTHRLTFGTATTYTDRDGEVITITVGDGLSLVSSVHTVVGSASTYSNVITGNPLFGSSALEIAENQAVTQIVSQFNERRSMNFNAIFSTDDPTTVNEIRRTLKSTSDVDAVQSGVMNVYENKYEHIILPYLATDAVGGRDTTKAKYWGLVALGQGVAGWQAYIGIWEKANMKSPGAGNNLEDGHNDNWTYGIRGAWGIAVLSGRGFLLSTGLGS